MIFLEIILVGDQQFIQGPLAQQRVLRLDILHHTFWHTANDQEKSEIVENLPVYDVEQRLVGRSLADYINQVLPSKSKQKLMEAEGIHEQRPDPSDPE